MICENTKCIAYIGTYTSGKSEGIYIFEMDTQTGELKPAGVCKGLENPSYQVIDNKTEYLYTVMETEKFNGEKGGAVAAFAIDKKTGLLEFVNCQPTKGRVPCHISIDSSREYIFAANYTEGTISVFPISQDGSISPVSCIVKHEGSGPNKERQEKAHAHYVSLTPDEKYLCAVDLGIDRIMVYDFDREKGRLYPSKHPEVIIKPASGPRHMAFHPSGKFAYLINELSSDIAAFEYSSSDGTFSEIQYISTLPGESNLPQELSKPLVNYCSAIHISQDGQFLYGSNRGHDSIAIFKIDQLSGKLELTSITSTGGNFPRDFAIDPSGKFLYAANQNSDTIVVFRITQESGIIEPTGSIINVPDPVCIKFVILK
ncbi:MAG TPA: lactonase family protein [Clostridiales bacterium]|nr:lactonase family protein [Clostridiales bacterium]